MLLETLLDDPRILADDIFLIPVASVVLAVRPDIASAVVTVHLLQGKRLLKQRCNCVQLLE